MAKYRHKIFEMYDFRDEAILALTPKSEKVATELTDPESWRFKHLAVSRPAGVTVVEFKGVPKFGEENVKEVGEDFVQLAKLLDQDNKVLVDFTGVVSVNRSFIDALVLFTKLLQTKGSRIALCALEPTTRESFFVPR